MSAALMPRASAVKILSLSEAPSFKARKGAGIQTIVNYIQLQIKQRNLDSRCCLLMPSLESMAEYFNVSYLEVQEAMQILRERGYKCTMPGLFGDISV